MAQVIGTIWATLSLSMPLSQHHRCQEMGGVELNYELKSLQ